MKKIVLATVAAVILIGYPLSTYLLGVRAETAARAWVDTLPAAVPFLKIVRNDYQRGFFKATHNVEFAVSVPAVPGMGEQFVVTLQDEISHGPLPDFSGIGAARVKHTLLFPAKVQQELVKVLGDKAPLTAVTMLAFGGGGNTKISSPAFTYKDARGEASWLGIDANFDFSKDYQRVSYTMNAPGFSAKMLDGAELKVGKISATGQQDKLAQTESLYLGSANMSVESVVATSGPAAALLLTNLSYSAETKSPVASFVDAAGKLSVKSIKFGNDDWGAFEYAFNAKHLHAPSVDAMGKAMRQAYAKPSDKAPPAEAAAQMQTAILDVLKQHGGALLKQDPTLELERLRVGTDRDYLSLSANARVNGVTDADTSNPMLLIPKVNARAEVALTETMLAKITSKASGKPADGGADEMALMVNAQLDSAVAQGYIIRGDGALKSTITFAEGKLLINGRPVEGLK